MEELYVKQADVISVLKETLYIPIGVREELIERVSDLGGYVWAPTRGWSEKDIAPPPKDVPKLPQTIFNLEKEKS